MARTILSTDTKDCVQFVSGDMCRQRLTNNEIHDIISSIEHNRILTTETHVTDWGTVFCVGKIHPILVVLDDQRSDDWLVDKHNTLLASLRDTAVVHGCRIKRWLNEIDSNFSDTN